MVCEICQLDKPGLNWVSGTAGAYLVCEACAEPLRVELRDILAYFQGCDTAESLLEALLAASIDITRADMGNVQLVDEHRVLRIRAQVGFQPEFLDFFSVVHDNDAACGTAAANRRTVMVADVDRSPIFAGSAALEILQRAGVRGVQSIPMFARSGALVGIVSTHFRQPRALNYHDLDLVGHLAVRAANLLEELVPLVR